MAETINQTNYPLVSVIIPAYNAAGYIKETIESVLYQSWQNVEIIVIDDNSTDNTFEIASQFNNNKLKVHKQPLNLGASAARNYGLTLAKGTYIQFLDADDLLSNDKLTTQVISLNNHINCLAVCSTVHFPDGQNHLAFAPSTYEEKFLYTTNNSLEFVTRLWGGVDLNGSMIQPGAWLVTRALIEKAGYWNEELTLDDDGEFFARLMLASGGIIKSGGSLYYRKHTGTNNLSSQKNLKSLVQSTLLKCKYINKLKSEDVYGVEKAMYRQLLETYLKCYPQNANLCQPIKHELKLLPDFKYRPRLGGKLINIITNIFGWKIARLIQHQLNQFKPNQNTVW